MRKNKNKIFLAIFLSLLSNSAFSITLDELNYPMPPAGRLGVSQTPELPYQELKPTNNVQTVNTKSMQEVNDLSYADLSLKRLADEVSYDLNLESDVLLSDLQILWNAAASKSETIKYTIYKLSNPDEDKPNENILKKIIKPVASFSTIAGTALSANPYAATGALIGGGLLNAFTKDDKEINYKFSKVNDTDMVILVRKIDDLQKKLLKLYIDYLTKKEILSMTLDNLEKRTEIYQSTQNKKREELVVADVYYRNAQNATKKAEADFWASRTILENLVGKQALAQIEDKD